MNKRFWKLARFFSKPGYRLFSKAQFEYSACCQQEVKDAILQARLLLQLKENPNKNQLLILARKTEHKLHIYKKHPQAKILLKEVRQLIKKLSSSDREKILKQIENFETTLDELIEKIREEKK